MRQKPCDTENDESTDSDSVSPSSGAKKTCSICGVSPVCTRDKAATKGLSSCDCESCVSWLCSVGEQESDYESRSSENEYLVQGGSSVQNAIQIRVKDPKSQKILQDLRAAGKTLVIEISSAENVRRSRCVEVVDRIDDAFEFAESNDLLSSGSPTPVVEAGNDCLPPTLSNRFDDSSGVEEREKLFSGDTVSNTSDDSWGLQRREKRPSCETVLTSEAETDVESDESNDLPSTLSSGFEESSSVEKWEKRPSCETVLASEAGTGSESDGSGSDQNDIQRTQQPSNHEANQTDSASFDSESDESKTAESVSVPVTLTRKLRASVRNRKTTIQKEAASHNSESEESRTSDESDSVSVTFTEKLRVSARKRKPTIENEAANSPGAKIAPDAESFDSKTGESVCVPVAFKEKLRASVRKRKRTIEKGGVSHNGQSDQSETSDESVSVPKLKKLRAFVRKRKTIAGISPGARIATDPAPVSREMYRFETVDGPVFVPVKRRFEAPLPAHPSSANGAQTKHAPNIERATVPPLQNTELHRFETIDGSVFVPLNKRPSAFVLGRTSAISGTETSEVPHISRTEMSEVPQISRTETSAVSQISAKEKSEVSQIYESDVCEFGKASHCSCAECGAEFHDLSTLTRHLVDTHEEEGSKDGAEMENESKESSRAEETRLECLACEKIFSSSSLLEAHKSTCHSDTTSVTYKEPSRRNQAGNSSTPELLLCEDISKNSEESGSSSSSKLAAYLKKPVRTLEDGKKKFQCPMCSKNIGQRRNYVAHVRAHFDTRERERCPTCGKNILKEQLEVHMKKHDWSRSFKCLFCDRAYRFESELDKHHFLEHSGKGYKCKVCSAAFGNRWGLRCHMRSHAKHQEYNCDHCDKSFDKLKNLSNHKKWISELGRHECSVCHVLISARGLISHMKIHSVSEPHGCTVCGERFLWRNCLKQHLQTHLGERRMFDCDQCDKRYVKGESLRSHKARVHGTDAPFRCDVCEVSFKAK